MHTEVPGASPVPEGAIITATTSTPGEGCDICGMSPAYAAVALVSGRVIFSRFSLCGRVECDRDTLYSAGGQYTANLLARP